MSIKAVDLNFVYGGGTALEQHALFDVNLEIEDGEFVGLIGHTGSGKSTLIQHLNGLIKASAGELYYNGENIYSQGYYMKQLRSKVGLVFQYPEHQLFEVDVLTDVCFGPKNQGLSREEAEARAKKALEQVGLPCGIFLVYAALKLGASSLQFFDQKSTGVRFQQIAMGLAVQIFLLFCHAASSHIRQDDPGGR